MLFDTQYAIRNTQNEVASTTVVRALQIHPFLTNKANFQKSQVSVTDLITGEYELMDTWSSGKNKANSKPKQSQFKANSKPKQSQTKPISEAENDRGGDQNKDLENKG